LLAFTVALRMSFDLSCIALHKQFGTFKAVDDVSFDIPSGSFFSILGPSGCGKTTLMRMIAGFEAPSSGDIHLKGKSVLALPPNRRNVKMVFQHLALFPMMNVGENIAYGLRCQGKDKAEIKRRVADVLERVGLPDAASKDVSQLSGGQKQRIAIARCMVLDPDVLLLDEPLGALDLKLREHMKIELKQLQSQFETTFVYITHDQSEALVMSDKVAVMNEGKFEQIGTPQELYHNPGTPFVAGFVGESNRWQGRVLEADADSMKLETDNGMTLCALTDKPMRQGDTVSIYVRPEAISVRKELQAAKAGAPLNQLQGVIQSVLFNGANSRLLVRSADGQLLETEYPQAGEQQSLAVGDSVSLTWAWGQSRCFQSA